VKFIRETIDPKTFYLMGSMADYQPLPPDTD
jgi:hypothetical protein